MIMSKRHYIISSMKAAQAVVETIGYMTTSFRALRKSSSRQRSRDIPIFDRKKHSRQIGEVSAISTKYIYTAVHALNAISWLR